MPTPMKLEQKLEAQGELSSVACRLPIVLDDPPEVLKIHLCQKKEHESKDKHSTIILALTCFVSPVAAALIMAAKPFSAL